MPEREEELWEKLKVQRREVLEDIKWLTEQREYILASELETYVRDINNLVTDAKLCKVENVPIYANMVGRSWRAVEEEIPKAYKTLGGYFGAIPYKVKWSSLAETAVWKLVPELLKKCVCKIEK